MNPHPIYNRDISAVVTASIYLFIYCILLHFERTRDFAILMLVFSPFLVVWMVYTVLKHGKYTGPELKEGEEYGYADKKKDELGIF